MAVLEDIGKILGVNRKVCVAFNLTMEDEEIIRGNVIEVISRLGEIRKKGECVIVIAGAKESMEEEKSKTGEKK